MRPRFWSDAAICSRPADGGDADRGVFDSGEFGYLVSPVTGDGVRVDRLTQFYLLARRQSAAHRADMPARIGAAMPGADGTGRRLSSQRRASL
jgi:hypothetical protein